MSRYGDHSLGNQTFGGSSVAIGTTGTALPEFLPPIGPTYVLPIEHRVERKRFRSESGYERVTVKQLRPTRTIRLIWPVVSLAQIDEIYSFFDQFEGLGGPFYWRLPSNRPVRSPLGLKPILDETGGGSLALRTYYVAFSWYSQADSDETLASKEATRTVNNNNLLKVSVPIFLAGVDRVRIYASETSGSLELQATINATEWTEPASGLISGAAPPASNTLTPLIPWVLSSDSIGESVVQAAVYSLELTFTEQKVV